LQATIASEQSYMVYPEHSHDVDKIDAILPGHSRVAIGGQSVIIEAGDCLIDPKAVEVIGSKPIISLDAIKTR